jgi:hypothetical protein
MSNHAAGTRCSASVRLDFSGPTPFFESTYYYHRLLAPVATTGRLWFGPEFASGLTGLFLPFCCWPHWLGVLALTVPRCGCGAQPWAFLAKMGVKTDTVPSWFGVGSTNEKSADGLAPALQVGNG